MTERSSNSSRAGLSETSERSSNSSRAGLSETTERSIVSYPKYSAVSNIYCISGTYGGYSGPNNLYSNFDPDKFCSNIIKIHTSSDLTLCVNEAVEVIINFNKLHNLPIILVGWSQGGYTVINSIKNLASTKIYKNIKMAIIISSRPENTDYISEMININKYIICGNLDTDRRLNGAKEMFKRASEPKTYIEITNGTHNYEYSECFYELDTHINKIISGQINKFL